MIPTGQPQWKSAEQLTLLTQSHCCCHGRQNHGLLLVNGGKLQGQSQSFLLPGLWFSEVVVLAVLVHASALGQRCLLLDLVVLVSHPRAEQEAELLVGLGMPAGCPFPLPAPDQLL